MQIDIWSDIRCPFCYIGKQNFQQAVGQFENKADLKISWNSFELDPDLKIEKSVNYVDYFSEKKGVSKEQALEMFRHVIKMGEESDIRFHLEKAIVANSFNAHRMIHYAKTENKEEEIIDRLFRAHFIKGENIDNDKVLIAIGEELNLDSKKIEEIVHSTQYTDEVRKGEYLAKLAGISSVPFFIFNNKHVLKGAQPVEVFLDSIQKSFSEFSAKEI